MLRKVFRETDPTQVRVYTAPYRSDAYFEERRRVALPSSNVYAALGVGFSGPAHAVPHFLHAIAPDEHAADTWSVPAESAAMRHGTVTEAEALARFASHMHLFTDAPTITVPQSPPMHARGLHKPSGAMVFGATPDGLFQDVDGALVGVEIKCPYYQEDPWEVCDIPPRVIAQCYSNMYVLGTKKHYLVCYIAPTGRDPHKRCKMAVYVFHWRAEVWKNMMRILVQCFSPLLDGTTKRFPRNGRVIWREAGLPCEADALLLECEFL